MSEALIRQAFESTLKTWADAQSPAIPVAFENFEFTQPAGRYLRAFLLPGDTDSGDVGRVNRRFVGVFQISIVMPTGDGPGAAGALVEQLRALFPPSAPIVVSGLSVWAQRPLSRGPALQERDRYVVPCSVFYLADTY